MQKIQEQGLSHKLVGYTILSLKLEKVKHIPYVYSGLNLQHECIANSERDLLFRFPALLPT